MIKKLLLVASLMASAGGSHTFAGGADYGQLLLTDQPRVHFYATAANQLNARFSGGYRFITGTTVAFATGGGGPVQSVAWTPGSGGWTFASDRNLKDRFAPVNARAVLEKVAQLPITEWCYKGYDQRHIGAMAQDFHALFPLNDNDKVLNEADLHGVELAAIKGLNQKINEQQALIERLEKRLDQMQQRLERQDQRDLITGN
jgi:hypothetical protein